MKLNEEEKKIAQEILKLLDGVPFESVKDITEWVIEKRRFECWVERFHKLFRKFDPRES